jgi:hypothetical protein
VDRTVEICYDRYRDVLFGSIRPELQTQAEPVAVDLFLLHDRATGDVVGFECVDFSEHVKDDEWLESIPDITLFYDLREPTKMLSFVDALVQFKEEISSPKQSSPQPALALRNVMVAG